MPRDRRRKHQARRRPAVQPLEPRALMASDGSLDPGFGNGRGYVTVTFPSSANPVALFESATNVQLDGKILLGGEGPIGASGSTFVVARLEPDGSPDPTFGTGGIFVDHSLPAFLSAYTVQAVQADGKILEAGTVDGPVTADGDPTSEVVVIRLDADGTLDTTYGKNGLAEFAIPVNGSTATDPGIEGAAIQADGKLVLGGTVSVPEGATAGTDVRFAAARLNTDGTLDATFGGTGTVTAAVTLNAITQDQDLGLAVQPGGRIVLAGWAANGPAVVLPSPPGTGGGPTPAVLVLARPTSAVAVAFTPTGTLDATFGDPATPGISVVPSVLATPSSVGFAEFRSVASEADGKLVLAETDQSLTGGTLGPISDELIRLGAAGAIDASFGTAGRTAIPGLAEDQFGPLAIQADGKIIVAGFGRSAADNTDGTISADRVDADGSLDPSFQSAGLTIPGLGLATGSSLALVPGGGIILATSSLSTGTAPGQFVAARLTSTVTPTLPPAVSQPPADYDGSGRTNFATYYAGAGAFLTQPSAGGPVVTTSFGIPGAGQTLPAPGDYTGAGHAEIAAYLTASGLYAIRPAGGGPDIVVPFGIPGVGQSLPAPGDYEGSGRDDIAVYLPSIGAFGIRPAGGGPDQIVPFGIAGTGQSLPAPADYFGTGRDDIAVYLASIGAFAIRNPAGGPDQIIPFGLAGLGQSIPIPGDYDGSGHVELGVYMPSIGTFAYRPYKGGPDVIEAFGTAGDGSIPVPGDYSGSGHDEIAVYDPNYATFAYRPASGGPDVIQPFGTVGLATSLPAAAPSGAISGEVQAVSGTSTTQVSAASLAVSTGSSVPAGPVAKTAARRDGRSEVPQGSADLSRLLA